MHAAADPVVGRHGVGEPVGAELLGRVDPDRHAGLQPGPDQRALAVEVALDQLLVLVRERAARPRRRSRRRRRQRQRAQAQQRRDHRGQLVRGREAHRREAPVLQQRRRPGTCRGGSGCCRRRWRAARRGIIALGAAGSSGAPIAWKPPSTCTISPVIPRARSDSRKQTASATGAGSLVSHPSGACAPQRPASLSKPGMPPAAGVSSGRPRRGSRACPKRRGRGRDSARPTRAPPWPRPSSRRRARRPRRRSRARRTSRPGRPSAAARAPAKALKE